jgi:hypothetical protein
VNACLVSRGQSIRNLSRNIDGLAKRQLCPPQGLTVDQLTDEVILANVIDCYDIGMVQRRHGQCLLLKPVPAIGIGCEFSREQLQSDQAVEARVTGFVYLAHAAVPERAHDLIRAQLHSNLKRHERNTCLEP